VAIGVVAGAVAAFCLYRQINERIRFQAETRLAQHYTGLKVSVRAAQLVEGRGVRLYDLSIVEPGVEGPCAELLHVEELVLDCPTDVKNLISGDLPVRRATARRPTLRAARRTDGAWNIGRLLPLPQFSEHPPDVVWEDGTVEIYDAAKGAPTPLVVRDIQLTMSPATADKVQSKGDRPIFADAKIGTVPAPGVRQFHGTFTANGLRRATIEGWLDVQSLAFSIGGKAEGVEVSPELRETLPEPLPAKLLPLGDLRGQAEFTFQAARGASEAEPLRFDISGRLIRGRTDSPRLPRSLADIQATFHCDQNGFSIDNLTAQSGQTTLQMACRGWGLAQDSPRRVTVQVRQLELDRALFNILPPEMKDLWGHYLPAGLVDADAQFDFDGRAWHPTHILVSCRSAAFTHYKFRRRLEGAMGAVELKDDVLRVDLTAYAGRCPVRLTSEVTHPLAGEGAVGWFEATGNDIPIDEPLLAALPEKSQQVARAFDPRGLVTVYTRLWRDRPGEPMHQHLRLNVARGSIRYAKFLYPLANIHGELEMRDGNWTYRNLEGRNNAARVTCHGSLTHDAAGGRLQLFLEGRDVPLEKDLHDALSENARRAWDDLQPRGVVDLKADVTYHFDEKKLSLAVRVEPQRETTSIEPLHFPYRLDRAEGVLTYQDGHVVLQGCKAEHGPAGTAVKIAWDGTGDFQPDGRWNIDFTNLSVDRLRPDRDFCQALPERLKKAIGKLGPTGAVNLAGSLTLEGDGRPGAPLRSQWNLRIGLTQNSLQCGGVLLENLWGAVALRGAFDGQNLQTRGELALDSISYKDYQLKQVRGPLWIDNDQVLLGDWVDLAEGNAAARRTLGPPQTPRPITASLFDGTLSGCGWITLAAEPRFGMNGTLTGASLARCAQEVTTGRQKLRGKVSATIGLRGSGCTRNALTGGGVLQFSEADLYELPVMLSLLKILSIRPPDQNAFSDGAIKYRIAGEHVYFDTIDFRGDAISLRGNGEMNSQSQIGLTFYAMVGHGDLEVPVVTQILHGASQQLMLIRVGGTLQNPEPRQEALPELNQALQRLRNELQSRR
jgi:hypothetical protein